MSDAAPDAEPQGPIVVGYDGDDQSEHVLDYAFEEATLRKAPVVVLIVAAIPYEWVDPYGTGAEVAGAPVAPIPPEGPPEVQAFLAHARDRIGQAGIPGEAIWGLGDPVDEIVRIADERNASAIVLGSHHHSAIGRLLGTDTAAAIVRESHCDVLIAR